MGMLGHAAVRRHDGAVFVHLHPSGTVSMASQQVSEQRDAARRGEGMAHAIMDHGAMARTPSMAAGRIGLPYAFPRPGTYRLWVQVKSGGKVYTGVFDAAVEAAR